MILGLRLVREGVPTSTFKRRFHRCPLEVYAKQVAMLEKAGLLECLPDRIRLSERGHLLANEALAHFLRS